MEIIIIIIVLNNNIQKMYSTRTTSLKTKIMLPSYLQYMSTSALLTNYAGTRINNNNEVRKTFNNTYSLWFDMSVH